MGLCRGVGGIEGGECAEKIVQRARGALFLQLLRRAIGDDFSAIDDHRAGARGIDLFENVRGKQNALRGAESLDQLADFVLLIRIEAIGGLIENQHLGIVQKRLGEAGAMAIALRERIDRLVSDGIEKTSLNRAIDRLRFCRADEIADIGAEFQKADDRHVIVKRCGFGEIADFFLGEERLVEDRVAADFGIARAGGDESGDHAHGRRLPGTIGAEETEDFARFDREREIIDRELRAKVFGEIFNFDHSNRCECFSSRVRRIDKRHSAGICLKNLLCQEGK